MDLDRLVLAELDSSLLQPAQAAPKLFDGVLDGGGRGPITDASKDAGIEGSTPSSIARSLHLRDTNSAVGAPTWARALLKSSSSANTDRSGSRGRPDATPLPSKQSLSADTSGTRASAQLAPDSADTLAALASFAVIALVLVVARPAFCVHVDAQGRRALRWDVIFVFSLLSAMLTWFACAWLP